MGVIFAALATSHHLRVDSSLLHVFHHLVAHDFKLNTFRRVFLASRITRVWHFFLSWWIEEFKPKVSHTGTIRIIATAATRGCRDARRSVFSHFRVFFSAFVPKVSMNPALCICDRFRESLFEGAMSFEALGVQRLRQSGSAYKTIGRNSFEATSSFITCLSRRPSSNLAARSAFLFASASCT